MTAPLTAGWSGLVVSGGNLDSTTYGQGTSFPSTWDVTRLFWRSDLGRMYYNKGTLGTPSWEGSDVPVGTINMYAGGTADVPSGWLLCNGAAVSRTTYSELFDRLDNEYGVGDGSTTFNLPDFVTSNIFPRGATNNAGRGGTGGSATHTLTGAESGAGVHSHTGTVDSHSHAVQQQYLSGGSSGSQSSPRYVQSSAPTAYADASEAWNSFSDVQTTGTAPAATVNNNTATAASSSHNNQPQYLDVHFIIAV